MAASSVADRTVDTGAVQMVVFDFCIQLPLGATFVIHRASLGFGADNSSLTVPMGCPRLLGGCFGWCMQHDVGFYVHGFTPHIHSAPGSIGPRMVGCLVVAVGATYGCLEKQAKLPLDQRQVAQGSSLLGLEVWHRDFQAWVPHRPTD